MSFLLFALSPISFFVAALYWRAMLRERKAQDEFFERLLPAPEDEGWRCLNDKTTKDLVVYRDTHITLVGDGLFLGAVGAPRTHRWKGRRARAYCKKAEDALNHRLLLHILEQAYDDEPKKALPAVPVAPKTALVDAPPGWEFSNEPKGDVFPLPELTCHGAFTSTCPSCVDAVLPAPDDSRWSTYDRLSGFCLSGLVGKQAWFLRADKNTAEVALSNSDMDRVVLLDGEEAKLYIGKIERALFPSGLPMPLEKAQAVGIAAQLKRKTK